MLLLIDNYDSFAHNLARYFVRLDCEVRVVRNDEVTVAEIDRWSPQAIVLSPGPCTPQEAGCCLELVRSLHTHVPMLGICLGHQAIVSAFGGQITRCSPMHGMTSQVHHDQQGVFAGAPTPLTVCRYHSLIADRTSMPEVLEVSSQTENGLVMSVRHRHFPIVGLQFHPESILTERGYRLLDNFLRISGLEGHAQIPEESNEYAAQRTTSQPLPQRPVTF